MSDPKLHRQSPAVQRSLPNHFDAASLKCLCNKVICKAKPRMGMDYCPAFHHEYVVSGRIIYRMADGSAVEAKAGDHVIIEPGHAGEVVGDELCVLVDW